MTKYNYTGVHITEEANTIIDMGICVLAKAELNKVRVSSSVQDTAYRQEVIPGYAGILHYAMTVLSDELAYEAACQWAAYSKKVVSNLHRSKLRINAAKSAIRNVKGADSTKSQVIVKIIKK